MSTDGSVAWFRVDNGGREILVTIVRGLFSTGTEADLYISSSRMSSALCEVTDSYSTTLTASFWASRLAPEKENEGGVRVLFLPVLFLCDPRT
jgi:hypothetical protein